MSKNKDSNIRKKLEEENSKAKKELLEMGISEAIIDEVEKQISPLFKQIYKTSPQYRKFTEELKKIRIRIKNSLDFLYIILTNLAELDSPEITSIISKRNLTFLNSYNYLAIVESIGTTLLDIALFLLIINGVDIHLEPDRNHIYTRHATSLDDIESSIISLWVKLDVLDQNSLPIFSKMIDRKLRNNIAHSDFKVEENGDLIMFQPLKKINIIQKILELAKYSSAVSYSVNKEIGKLF